jgi:protein-S-isoprenylcysteine O-methyltransferase Ste14
MLPAAASSSAIDSSFARGGARGIACSVALIAYSLVSYLVGVAGLGLLILATAGLVPLGAFRLANGPSMAAIINVGLLLLFGVQHSVMARASFKRRLHRMLPAALERSTYVWTSGVALGAAVLFWQRIDGVVWQTGGFSSWLLLGIGAFGWVYLFAATFAINHWDLFGLRQSWLAARGEEYTNVSFEEKWMYRYSRHPIMLGALIGIWSIPTMTATQCFLSGGLTLYIVLGVYFEERDLIRQWGQSYLDYKRRVGALLSIPRR